MLLLASSTVVVHTGSGKQLEESSCIFILRETGFVTVTHYGLNISLTISLPPEGYSQNRVSTRSQKTDQSSI